MNSTELTMLKDNYVRFRGEVLNAISKFSAVNNEMNNASICLKNNYLYNGNAIDNGSLMKIMNNNSIVQSNLSGSVINEINSTIARLEEEIRIAREREASLALNN